MKTCVCLLYILALNGIICQASSFESTSDTPKLPDTLYKKDKQKQGAEESSKSSESNIDSEQDPSHVTTANGNLYATSNQKQTQDQNYTDRGSTAKYFLEFGEKSSFATERNLPSTCSSSRGSESTESVNFTTEDVFSATLVPTWNSKQDYSYVTQKGKSAIIQKTTSGHMSDRDERFTLFPDQTTINHPSFEAVRHTTEITTLGMDIATHHIHTTTRSSVEEGPTSYDVTPGKNDQLSGHDDNFVQQTRTQVAETSSPRSISSEEKLKFYEKYGGILRPVSEDGQENDDITLQLNVTARYCGNSVCEETGSPVGNCYCDDICYFYNDCCYYMIEKLTKEMDSKTNILNALIEAKVEAVENKTLMLTKEMISCIGGVNNASAFIMIRRCDENIPVSQGFIKKCEMSDKLYSISDVPVDHVVNNKVLETFKNIYCAFCNGISQNELLFWKADITCDTGDMETILEMELHEIAKMTECQLQPHSLLHDQLRRCSSATISPDYCQINSTADIQDLCNSYIYPLTIDNTSSLIYRNPHCAACTNGTLNTSRLYCVDTFEKKFKPEHNVKPGVVNLKVFFDFSPNSGIVSKVKCGQSIVCKSYEVYDCVSKRCSQLYCSAEETPWNGKCIKTSKSSIDFVTGAKRPIDSSANGTDVKNTSTFIVELLDGEDLQLVVYALGTTSGRIMEMIYEILLPFQQTKSKIGKYEECLCIIIESSEESINIGIMKDLFPKLVIFFDQLEEKENHGYTLIPLFITIRNFKKLSSLECSTGKLFIDTKPSIVESNSDVAFALPSSGILVQEQSCGWQLRYNKTIGVFSNLIVTCLLSNLSTPYLNCPMVAYDLDDVIIANNSVKILYANVTIYDGNFAVSQNKVFICSKTVTDIENFVNIFLYSANHRVLSVVTSSVSVVSAIVIIFVHCSSKRLRNIHGLNLSALSFSILFLHLLLISQSYPIYPITNTLCFIYAVALHFILINSFVWMNIIGYDITRIFASDSILTASSPFKRFLRYIFISVALPVLITAVGVALEFTRSAFKPGYGDRDLCWLSGGKSILVFVVGPVILSLFLNGVFFTFTIIAIKRKIRQTKFARKSASRSYVVVYLKLTIVLGLTWVFGIVGAFVQQEWFWVVHLLLNGFQGLSLLVCSGVNAQNVRQLKYSLKSSTSTTNGILSKTRVNVNTKV